MLTPQQVEERVFPKAKKGGYDMQDVDNFLDELTVDYTELYKENAVLKRKMKVLADKITEYQETEGAMRATLLAAQKMAADIVAEAEAKRDQILAEAENLARQKIGSLSEQVAQEEARLKTAKASVATMVTSIQELLAHEQEFLAALPQMEVEVPPVAPVAPSADTADAVAAEIGDSISRIMDAPAEEPAVEEAPVEESKAADDVADEVDSAPTRRMDLSELRFGRNYEI